MKKAILLLAIAITGVLAVEAQGNGGGFQRRTPEERLQQVKEKLADLKLDKDQTTKSDSAFIQYFRDQQKIFEDMRNGGGDRTAIRDKMMKLAGDRDDKLKKIYTDDQYKKWKEEIEPTTRPQRGNRGGGGNRAGGNN